MPAVLLNNAIYGGQTEAGAFADVFGGEERFEDARDGGRVHANAGVADRQQDVLAGSEGLVILAEGFVELNGISLEDKLATLGHGIA